MSYAVADEVTVTFSDLGYENAQEVTELTINEHLKATFSKGGNSSTTPKYYNTGKAYRLYAMNTMTITANNGCVINAVSMATGSGDYVVNAASTVSKGTLAIDGASATISDINANEMTFTQGGSKGHVRIVSLTVTYSTDGTVTPDPEEPEGGEGEDEDEDEVKYATIAEIIAAGAGEAATKGTVVATYARGFLMNDGTGSILVYLGSAPAVAAGDAVTVSGKTSSYGGLMQFAAGTSVEKTGTATVTHPTVTVMDGAAMDAFLTAPTIKYVEYTGTLTISGNYYNVAVEGTSKAIGSIQYPQDAIKANLATGSIVKVTGYTIGVSSSKYVNTMAVKVEVVNGGEEPEEPETPVETKEYTVTEALAAYVDGQQIPAIVKGYIVGAMNSTGYVPEFGTTTVKTNIMLSDNPNETEEANCIIVQLPSGQLRTDLNLADNPDNYKKEIKITGSIEKYFQVAGLKNPTAYEFTGATGIGKLESENNNARLIYDLTGRKVEVITAPGIYIVNGKKVLVK